MYNVRRILNAQEIQPEILDKGIAKKKKRRTKKVFPWTEKIQKHTHPWGEKQEIMQRP